ncbi:hypothetical protein [Nocardia bhagyanarayanae]|uniref:hypothetical protein n=1 Tax=Nocardia bhagyanarayanae TaxID=1215925 RepID=UPI001C8ABC4C|nr:hypothetical protein [Nocardia bhagyanarayanae]
MTDQPTASRLRRYAPRIVLAFGVTVAVAIGAVFAATPLLRIPGPTTLVHLLSDPPSTQGGLFESRTVPAAPTPRRFPAAPAPLPDTVPWKGSRVPAAEFLAATGTNSFLVVRDGKLTTEWYRAGVGPTTKQSSWSVAKSVVPC